MVEKLNVLSVYNLSRSRLLILDKYSVHWDCETTLEINPYGPDTTASFSVVETHKLTLITIFSEDIGHRTVYGARTVCSIIRQYSKHTIFI